MFYQIAAFVYNNELLLVPYVIAIALFPECQHHLSTNCSQDSKWNMYFTLEVVLPCKAERNAKSVITSHHFWLNCLPICSMCDRHQSSVIWTCVGQSIQSVIIRESTTVSRTELDSAFQKHAQNRKVRQAEE